MTATWEALAAALAAVPRLHGAECGGRHELFDVAAGGPTHADEDVEYARQAAIRLCATCPALQRCRAWFTSLPPNQRPPGITAGLFEGKEPKMTDSDPAATFKQRVAGKTITVTTRGQLVENGDGEPEGVEPGSTAQYAFDEDGICCPVWETDETTPEGETTKND